MFSSKMITNNLISIFIYRKIKNEKKKKNKRFAIHPINKHFRTKIGFQNIVQAYMMFPSKFRDLFRMKVEDYQFILDSIFMDLVKLSRNAFLPNMRLDVTLRFLCSGLLVSEIAHEFLIGESTASQIIFETCTAIVKNLKSFVKFPSSEKEWYAIARDFYVKNKVPNSIGCIDGKHIWIKKPPKSGSAYRNYKHGFSLSLLAICDANYMFTYYDIGSYGSESDSGIYKDSLISSTRSKSAAYTATRIQ